MRKEQVVSNFVNMVSSLAEKTNSTPVIFKENRLGFLCSSEKEFFKGFSSVLLGEIFTPEKLLDKNILWKLLLILRSLSIERVGSWLIFYSDIPISKYYLEYLPFPKLNFSDEGLFDLISGLVYKDTENE